MIITHLSPLELKRACVSLTWDNVMTGPLHELTCSFLLWPFQLSVGQWLPFPLDNGSVFLLVTRWHWRMKSNTFSFVDVGCDKHCTQTGILKNQVCVCTSSAGPGALILLRCSDIKRSPEFQMTRKKWTKVRPAVPEFMHLRAHVILGNDFCL